MIPLPAGQVLARTPRYRTGPKRRSKQAANGFIIVVRGNRYQCHFALRPAFRPFRNCIVMKLTDACGFLRNFRYRFA